MFARRRRRCLWRRRSLNTYRIKETDLSYSYLRKILVDNKLDAVLIGGWAVYLLVNSEFRRRNGFNYVGSRDIDIGFRLEPDWDKETLMESEFASALRKLKNLGFKPVSFRQQISYDYETLEILTGADLRNKPEHEIFRLYVDMVVNVIPECFEEAFGFTPVDEPLLDLAFHQGKDHTVFIDDAGVRTVKSEVLLAMKLNSLPNRTRDDKRLKDISDIYALSWYSGTRFNVIKHKLYGFYPREMVREVISSITDGEYSSVSGFINVPKEEIITVLSNLSK